MSFDPINCGCTALLGKIRRSYLWLRVASPYLHYMAPKNFSKTILEPLKYTCPSNRSDGRIWCVLYIWNITEVLCFQYFLIVQSLLNTWNTQLPTFSIRSFDLIRYPPRMLVGVEAVLLFPWCLQHLAFEILDYGIKQSQNMSVKFPVHILLRGKIQHSPCSSQLLF